MTTDFRFYLNRQGIQGRKGEQGEQGYSPTITVKSQTANEYVLTVQNEDGSFDTPNLRGNAIENRGGTYIRYNPNTEEMYTGDADLASTQRAGVVFLSTYEQLIAGGSENLVPTSQDVYNFVSQQIISGFVTQQEFETYTAATAITLNNLSTQKLSFADLSSAIVAGSNITLSVDSENNTITINAAGGDLSNYVTLGTAQTITNSKTFDGNGAIHFSNTSNGVYFEDSSSTERIRIFTTRHSSGTDYSDLTMQSYSDIQFRLLSPATTVKLTDIIAANTLANSAIQLADLTDYAKLNQIQFFTALQNFSGGISLPTGNAINFHSPTTGSSGSIYSPSANTLQIRANTININSGGSSPIVKNLFDMIQLSDLSIASTSSNWLNYNNVTGEFGANVDTIVTQNSNNLITSDAVYGGLEAKQNTITDLSSIRSGAELGSTSEQLENKVSSIDATSSDTEYPSAKCVYDNLETKADASQTHALKGYSDNGELLTDAEGLADVKSYAHSTFDRSKFTVAGSPNITDDGIVSGFSSGNRLDTILLDITKPWQVQFKMKQSKAGSDTGGIMNFNYGQSGNHSNEFYNNGIGGTEYGLKLRLVLSDNSVVSLETSWNTGFLYDIFYDTIIGWDGNTYFWKYKKATETEWIIKSSDSSLSLKAPTTANLLRIGMSGYNYAGGLSIDLKQFSVTVGGVEVFSGNKTGLDVIKPDNYTVVGTPTISADGILSNCSANDYLTASNIDLTSANEVILESAVTLPTTAPTVEGITPCTLIRCGKMSLDVTYKADNTVMIGARVPSNYSNRAAILSTTCDGSTYIVQGIFTGLQTESPQYYCRAKKITENNWTQQQRAESVAALAGQTSSVVNMGAFAPGGSIQYLFLYGKMGLSCTKIYIDGNLVYQPCLKIPYTESKTGSKIVQSVYRDRVNDMAKQFGYANYYTLDEDNGNFTLPQVELYGLIGDKTLRDSYYNGVTYWELFSNRRLEQGGTCESGVEYTLPKPFADANYVLTIPYSSKTATSFIPSATGDFIAKGMGLL